jgi:hypothetical protein
MPSGSGAATEPSAHALDWPKSAQDAPSDGDKHPVCFSGFPLAADELYVRQEIMKNFTATGTLCILLSLSVVGCKIPKTSYTTAKAPVLKVYTTSDVGHTFVAYVVDRGGVEIVVSDTLGKSSHKVGDTINYLDQKIEVDGATRTLSFTLTNWIQEREQDAPSDGDKHPVCFSCFHLAADELDVSAKT